MIYLRVLLVLASTAGAVSPVPGFRPPSIPLISQSPLVSVWTSEDSLNGGGTRFWNGSPNTMVAMCRVADETYLLMGDTASIDGMVAMAIQKSATGEWCTWQSLEGFC